ncbi:MAG: DUF4411 family protein [Gammaproteobacteria bacterium]|nr:DUF4411 family protein [Gammaproteobacteria bacterium]MBU1777415.1 DUF4411 family protein [Gammaproteobacteria bacterium]MBU1969593.1 DUF4411 family protein [Gammaproteobacteria bacterium]
MAPEVIYLLDANTLIDAKRDYFEFERVPEYWEWLQHQGDNGCVKIPIEIYEEFEEARNADGDRDSLAEWAADENVKNALLFGEEVDRKIVSRVLSNGYGQNLTDQEIENIGNDPFLIAHALRAPGKRVVVTTEVSKPAKQRANRRVPDVCRDLGIRCINNFQLLRELDFKTGWKK